MHDSTPAPFGEITRRWTHLDRDVRNQHVLRLLGACERPDPRHVDRPGMDLGHCYRELVVAALAGDEVAFGWLATSHRPLLLVRGRALYDDDPCEWGGVCTWILLTALDRAPTSEGRWLRRHVARRLSMRVSAEVEHHLRRRRREVVSSHPGRVATESGEPADGALEYLDLSVELDRVLARLDAPSRDGILALAGHEPLAEVAARHGLSYPALRQRVSRARHRLQPQLEHYRRPGLAHLGDCPSEPRPAVA